MSGRGIVIADVDPGIDDAFALLVLVAAHKLQIISLAAVVCSMGNVKKDQACKNIEDLISVFSADNKHEIQFFEGAEYPIIKDGNFDEYFGKDGLGDVDSRPNAGTSRLRSAYEFGPFIANLSQNNPNSVSLISFGPLTATATLLLQQPNTTLKDIWIMGGNSLGYDTVEWNFYVDPHAAYSVLKNSKVPVYVTTFQTCQNVLVPMSWRNDSLGKINSTFINFMNEAETNFYNGNPPKYWEMYDPVVAVAFVNPDSVLRREQQLVDVHLGCYGDKEAGLLIEGSRSITFITEIDVKSYQNVLLSSAVKLA